LPCAYYLLTFTLPQALRTLAWSHQKAVYGLLLSSAAVALQKLAWDPKYLGGQLAALAVLHTWTRALLYHPHAHLLVTAGGLARDGEHWLAPKNPAFLVPCFALSKIFRGKFRAGLKKLGLLEQVPSSVWSEQWVVHCQHAGHGEKAINYLGRYVFRIAISNSRLERFENGQVTFRYRDNRTQQLKHLQLSAPEFIQRFLQHVLPKGLVKVRAYGLWSATNAEKLKTARALLARQASTQRSAALVPQPLLETSLTICPSCKIGHLVLIASLLPERIRGP
jgi:hypothetical protein